MNKQLLQTQKYIYSFIPKTEAQKFPGEIGLRRMEELLSYLGNPQDKFKSIHIAGTSGKGSTSYLISKIMRETGLKVGLHTSPHLQTMRERIQVNGQIIGEAEFVKLIEEIKPAIKKVESGIYGKSSFYEVLLAASFYYFAKNKVELAVIETGLGGRIDGTNVLKSTVAVITNVGLDHTEVLGKTKELILKDKMHIIKSSCKFALTGITQKKYLRIFNNHCQTVGVPLCSLDLDFKLENQVFEKDFSSFDFTIDTKKIKEIKLSMSGVYPANNACLAIASCLKYAKVTNSVIKKDQIKKALFSSFFPGRMEVISKKPLIILDGAHNEDKMNALIKSIKQLYKNQQFVVVFAVKKDKDASKMLKQLNGISKKIVITQFKTRTDLGEKVNYSLKKLFDLAKQKMQNKDVCCEKDSFQAYRKAKKMALSSNSAVLVTGSLYLVGEIRQAIKLKASSGS